MSHAIIPGLDALFWPFPSTYVCGKGYNTIPQYIQEALPACLPSLETINTELTVATSAQMTGAIVFLQMQIG